MTEIPKKLDCPDCGGVIAPRIAFGGTSKQKRYWQCLECGTETTDPYKPTLEVVGKGEPLLGKKEPSR